jgi:tetratricopeptide (TPR) repeat protein
VHYDVDVTLHPADQTLSAKARVEFVGASASRALLVELHQDLKVASVRGTDGKSFEFERDSSSPLDLKVSLPDVVEPGKHLTLVFDYAGSVSNEDDSPSKGLRLAAVDRSSAYLLLPARWFPLTDYPSNRYTAVFKITLPDTFAVAGTGKAAAPSAVPASGKTPSQIAYTFKSDTAAPVGTFVAGAIRLTPVQSQGLNISVFAPASAPAAQGYGNALASIVNFFSSEFAPLADPNLTIAQMPDGSVAGFSAPGLLLVSARQWTAKVNESLLAQLAAGQWWGSQVLAASPSDVWLTDGLARYSEALYIQQAENAPGLHRMLEEFAVSALMYDDAAPIAQAQRLQLYSVEYRSVVVNKGAMVFQMLHALLGDSIFQSLLHDFYLKFAGKTVRLEDFEKMAEARAPARSAGKPPLNLVAFFSQWLNSTGVPEFKTDYIVYRTKKGFKVVGKIQQDLETFNMPVELRVDTEGNPETKTIQATGLNTEFQIDTFGRPKPNGLTVDPNNNLLKSSPRLRVHAAVARGEALAEQGKYFEAIQEYQKAVDVQGNNSLGHFRMAEAMFYQKNYQAAANEFRSALDGDLDPKWTEVWSHVYLGKIFDLTGQRERAVNEYSRAEQLKDDTSGAQEEAARYLQKPYTGDATPSSAATAKP